MKATLQQLIIAVILLAIAMTSHHPLVEVSNNQIQIQANPVTTIK